MKTDSPARSAAFSEAMATARKRLRDADPGAAFAMLERAHVLGQRHLGRHLLVHAWMLRLAWTIHDWHEVRGQLWQLILTPLSHITGRQPLLLLIVIGLVALDQALKATIASTLPIYGRIEVTSWFNLVHVLNPGAAFSFLATAGGWQRHFLTLVGLGVSGFLLWWLWYGVPDKRERIAYLCIVGGALGNVTDRIRLGAVVDYLDFHWMSWHWPAFNLADVFVVSGAALLVLLCFRQPGQRAPDTSAGPIQ